MKEINQTKRTSFSNQTQNSNSQSIGRHKTVLKNMKAIDLNSTSNNPNLQQRDKIEFSNPNKPMQDKINKEGPKFQKIWGK